jgi:hypothetical protein
MGQDVRTRFLESIKRESNFLVEDFVELQTAITSSIIRGPIG